MRAETLSPMLVVAREAELPDGRRVWGTGGWREPEEREALDWLTLARLSGWGVSVTYQGETGLDVELRDGNRWIIVACDPDHLGEDAVRGLASRLEAEPIVVVARAGARGGAFARLAGATHVSGHILGRALRWVGAGPERDWRCRTALEGALMETHSSASMWATLDGAPFIVGRRVGRGAVATLGFHPSRARDLDGAATALLRHLLIWSAMAPVAWFDLEHTLVLRMDDPGGAQSVHSRDWYYPKLGEEAWAAIGVGLARRSGRLSIGYSPGWVDDGDPARGDLAVAGHVAPRIPGRVHPSPLVKYRDRGGHTPGTLHDYEAEFRGIQSLRAAGLADVELHGYTHMHPDTLSWARAPDRYRSEAWYRELGSPARDTIAARPREEHPLALGVASLERYFGARPTTLICPGDEWTDEALERALDLDLYLVSSYYLAIRDENRFCWSTHVCAPYLDKPDPAWFDAGLPVVGYFHDREPALEGPVWIESWLERWQAAGARRLIDLRELAGVVSRRLCAEEDDGELCLSVSGRGAPPRVRPVKVFLRAPRGELPSRMTASLDTVRLLLDVDSLGDGLGCLTLPS